MYLVLESQKSLLGGLPFKNERRFDNEYLIHIQTARLAFHKADLTVNNNRKGDEDQ